MNEPICPAGPDTYTMIQKWIGQTTDLGVAVLDRNRHHIYYNREYLTHFGIDQRDLGVGDPFEKALKLGLHGSVEPEVAQRIDSLMQVMSARLNAGEVMQTKHVVESLEGRVIEMKGTYTPDHHLILTLEDITERNRKKTLLNIALESSKAGYWSYDFLSQKFTFSKSFKSRFEQEDLDKINQSGLWAILDSSDVPRLMEQWQAAMRGEAPVDFTCKAKTAKGEIWQRSVGEVIYNANGERVAMIALVRDITDEINAEKELVSARKSSRAKTEFLARMSHEIKTPLNAIIGLSDVLLSESGLTDDMRETVEYIDEAANGLHYLLSQTLDHAKLVSEKMEPDFHEYSPRKVLENACGFWRAQAASKKLPLKLHLDPDLPDMMMLDKFRLQQCLNNILSNAIKFTSTGHIRVVTKCVGEGDDRKLIIGIKDTGIGMTQDQVAKVFNPFEQADTSTSRKYGGTGLGMSITKQLAELMGGRIDVRSTPGEGTVFALTLPVRLPQADAQLGVRISGDVAVKPPVEAVDRSVGKTEDLVAEALPETVTPEASPEPQPVLEDQASLLSVETVEQSDAPVLSPLTEAKAMLSEQAEEVRDVPSDAPVLSPLTEAKAMLSEQTEGVGDVPFENLSVLCVEDNPVNQRVIKKMLGGTVAELYFAGNGQEALQILSVAHVDVILMDIHMPIMDGIETTMAIRNSNENWANVIIIALTADPDYQHRRVCRNLGMDDSIVKPVRRQDIIDAFCRSVERMSSDYVHPINLAKTA